METYEIVIVGAGPGGLKCAEILAKNNKKVLVLEKNSIFGDKVCAGGLTLKDLKLNIPDKIIQKKFKKIIIHTPFQDTEVKLDKPFLATLDRKDLGKWMANNAKKQGAELRLNSQVTKITEKEITINKKDKIQYKYLIGADGSNSIVRKYLGIKKNNILSAFQYIAPNNFKNLELFMDPEKYGPLYLWIFPYKKFVSIGTGTDLSKEIKQPALGLTVSKIKENFLKFCKGKINKKKSEFQGFTINYDYQGHEFKNKFLIGDAGGFASGLTGEGIYFAIKSGEDIAKKIINKKYKYPNIKEILKTKEKEEKLLRALEINKYLTEAEWEFLNLLLKIKWFGKKFAKEI
jgi:geranylgeranyl reductase family protein